MRIAAIDLGTNSIHMVIAEAHDTRGFEVIDREREVVQIGRGSFHASRLRADSMRRALEALQRFVELARRLDVDQIVCTATAAVREAENGGEFLTQAYRVTGVTPRVIPPEEEGRLIYLAVKSALGLDDAPALIVDIGGGSMQLVIGTRERPLQTASVRLGALRLTEIVRPKDPPTRGDLQRFERRIRKGVKEALATIREHEIAAAYGSSGAIHALANVAHHAEHGEPVEHINGHRLGLEALRSITRKLQRMTIAERETLPGIDAKRAEIIIPGAMVLLHVLEALKLDGITLSDYGVREGLVIDYIASHAGAIRATGHIPDVRLRSVMHLMSKFEENPRHAEQVARLALDLFDRLEPEHGLDGKARELLNFAALLHDVGSVIGYDGHGEHSYYIIKNAKLRGLTAAELEIIAIVARYHGKPRPKKLDAAYAGLSKRARRQVRWLAALLSIAESLDRSRYQLVRSIKALRRPERLLLRVEARQDASLELWAARQRIDKLAREVGRPVGIGLDVQASPARGPLPRPRRRARKRLMTTRGRRVPVRSASRKRPRSITRLSA
jgi:exopolyphosphatase/guanosine-5'-triphosphate,3'-diphosphate pyrophosphatase